MYQKLLSAAYSGDADFIREAAQLQYNNLLQVTVDGNSVLHIAAKLGHFDAASVVCNYQPSLLKLRNFSGDTPLQCAAAAGHLEIVRHFLLQRVFQNDPVPHQRVNILRVKNRVGDTALHRATHNGHLAVVVLLMKTDFELAATVNDAGVSALYMAAERGSVDIARILLQYPVASHQGPDGQVALHAAVLRSYEITEMILEKSLDHLRHGDSSNSTPLHFAAANGDLRMVQMLLQHDASVAYIQDHEGFSVIHVAASAGHLAIVKEVLVHCPDSMEQKNGKGRNFLHTAIEKKNLEVVKYVLKSPLLEELVNEQDEEGDTPLHLAVMSRDKKIIQTLLSSTTVDVGVTNKSGHTPVDLASSNVRAEIGLRMYNIMVDLILHGSRFSPQRADYMRNNLKRKKDEEIDRYRALANNLSIIAVLIATVTFAAAFTLPGGYKNDSGTDAGAAVLSSRPIFIAFLVSDTLAMACSITVAVILVYSGSSDHDVRLRSLTIAVQLLWVAVGGMTVAFAAGVYVAVAHDCQWVAVLVGVMSCGVPFVALALINWPSTDCLSRAELSLTPLLDKIREKRTGSAGFPRPGNQRPGNQSMGIISDEDRELMKGMVRMDTWRNQIVLAKTQRLDDMSFITPSSPSCASVP